MKASITIALMVLIAGCSTALPMAPTGQTGTARTDLQRYDLGVSNREVVQVRVDFDPGYTSPKHRHAGEEVIYVIEGTLEYTIEGHSPKVYRAGEVLTVPYGAVHWARNVGKDNGAELATYIVEKGKPLLVVTE